MAGMSRRHVLRGAGWAIALPWLEAFPRPARAADAPPKRLLFWFYPDGTMEDIPQAGGDVWWPKGNGSDFALGALSSPLEPIKSDVILLRGVDSTFRHTGDGNMHPVGMAHLLTGGGDDSIDQVLADKLKPGTAFPTLQASVATQKVGGRGDFLSFRGGKGVPAEANPNALFAKLFGDAGSTRTDKPGLDAAALQRLQARRKSVLDGVLDELAWVSGRASAADRKTLDAHASSIRDVENALAKLNALSGSGVASCSKPTVDFTALDGVTVWNGVDGGASVPHIDKIIPVQHDLLVLALRCDLTRFATFQVLYTPNDSQTFEFLPITNTKEGQHSFAHEWRNRPREPEDYKAIQKWKASMYVDLVQKLKAVPEAGGTLLDASMVVMCSEMGEGSTHSHQNIPFVIAGRGGGALRTGRYVVYGGEPLSRLHLSLAQAMGVTLPEFGWGNGNDTAAAQTRPLEGLVG